jgi:hypothetical protein
MGGEERGSELLTRSKKSISLTKESTRKVRMKKEKLKNMQVKRRMKSSRSNLAYREREDIKGNSNLNAEKERRLPKIMKMGKRNLSLSRNKKRKRKRRNLRKFPKMRAVTKRSLYLRKLRRKKNRRQLKLHNV